MIQINEIRWGNYIKTVGRENHWQVFVDDFLPIFNNPGNYEGIVLKKDMLLNLGFICHKHDRGLFYEKDGFHLNENFSFVKPDSSGYNWLIITDEIKYLHNLQNLFFSIKLT